ncbi:MAG TPA: hypothetical protein VF942_11470 [Acidimicrobiales bacterium]
MINGSGGGEWQALAGGQCGVISWQQLASSGLSANGVACLCKAGRIERLVRSVYGLPGWPPGWKRDLWIALMSAGRDAVVSHRSAAALHELDAFRPGRVELSVPKRRRPRLTGVRHDHVYRVNGKWFDPSCQIQGLAVTSATDTLLDLGSIVDTDRVERAVECALRRELTSVLQLETARDLRGGGASNTLRDVLRRRAPGTAPTESDAETLFLQLTRVAGLPDPERQFLVLLGGRRYRIDFVWPRRRFAVEVDGAETHANADALGRDLRRQNRIVMGWLLQRYTWEDVAIYADQVVEIVRDVWALLLAGPMPPSIWSPWDGDVPVVPRQRPGRGPVQGPRAGPRPTSSE